LETLADLSPEQLEAGCQEVLKTCVTFPKPSEILKAVAGTCDEYLGPRADRKMLDSPKTVFAEMDEDDKKAVDEASAKLRAELMRTSEPFRNSEKPKSYPLRISQAKLREKETDPKLRKRLEEQKKQLREKGYL
jgi:hypothetical protein